MLKRYKSRHPKMNGLSEWMVGFAVGERRYCETTLLTYGRDMRRASTPAHRRAECARHIRIECKLLTALSTAPGDIRYLICYERVK